jgi:hypothetical protein
MNEENQECRLRDTMQKISGTCLRTLSNVSKLWVLESGMDQVGIFLEGLPIQQHERGPQGWIADMNDKIDYIYGNIAVNCLNGHLQSGKIAIKLVTLPNFRIKKTGSAGLLK